MRNRNDSHTTPYESSINASPTIEDLKRNLPPILKSVTDLKRKTANEHAGPCPWCGGEDRFVVFNDENRFLCRGCSSRGGDIIDFHCKNEKTDIPGLMKKYLGNGSAAATRKTMGRYDFLDEDGNILYWKERIEPGRNGRDKEFFFFHGDRKKSRGCEAVLYNLPDVLKAESVIVTEGEKHADFLKTWGLTATSLDSGAKSKPTTEMIEQLNGKSIVILRDNDDAGLAYAETLAEALDGKCGSLKVVLLPGLPEKGDILDWVKETGNDKEKILKIIQETPEWERGANQGRASTAKGGEESDPIPFIRKHEVSEPFPVDAFPGFIGEAVIEYAEYGKQPLPMIATSVLSVISLVSQGHVNVARDSILQGPVSLNTCVVAESGERKSACDNHYRSSVYRWLEEKLKEFAPEVSAYQANLDLWEEERKGILLRIREITKQAPLPGSKEAEELDKVKGSYENHVKSKPAEIIEPALFYGDTNPASLGEKLTNGYPIAAVWTDEGMVVVGSSGMSDDFIFQFLGMLNKLWDNGCYENSRKTTSRINIRNKRISCNLMMQDRVFQELVLGHQGLARGCGLMARFLICKPESTIGTRAYVAPQDMPAKSQFDNRVKEILKKDFNLDELGGLVPVVLKFDSQAQKTWEDFYNETEKKLGPFGEFVDIKDWTSKIAENMSRIAACLHVIVSGTEGLISEETALRASKIAYWYLKEARRVMGLYTRTQTEEDAETLIRWLLQKGYQEKEFRAAELLRYAPNHLRDRRRRDAALEFLVEHRFIISSGMPLSKVALKLHPKAEEVL